MVKQWQGVDVIERDTKMAVSQPKIVRFSICKKDFEAKNVLYQMVVKPGAVLLEGRF